MNLPFPHKTAIPLSNFSTFGIGGPARFIAEARTCAQMQEMLQYAYFSQIPIFVLGKGSNSLFDDRGFNGLVILNKIDYLEKKEEGFFHVGSGYSFARLGGITARLGWSGLEFASGIPATVGGAIYMNAGANGKETADTLDSVTYLSEQGELFHFKKKELCFSYRKSCFQNKKGAIIEGSFQLNSFSEAKKKQKEILSYRLKTQPYGEKSAGCVFRNPYGFAAGEIIDSCGLKGEQVGGASISYQHANFIVNSGAAKARDVLELMQKIKEKIYKEKGIILEEEIHFVPYEA